MDQLYKENNFYFWEKKIKDSEDILFGHTDKKRLTRESVIIYIGILDNEKNILQSGWSCHGDVRAALGFLQFVFLPAAFFTWLDRDSDDFYIPLSPFDVLKTEVLRFAHKDCVKETEKAAAKMEKAYYNLSSIWDYDDEEKKMMLKEFCCTFNAHWNQEPERKLFVRMFEKCEEIADFILENEDDEFQEVIEEEIEMSIDQLRFTCQHAYDEPLISKNIIELLNLKLPIWF